MRSLWENGMLPKGTRLLINMWLCIAFRIITHVPVNFVFWGGGGGGGGVTEKREKEKFLGW
jgi:hypothetical protein